MNFGIKGCLWRTNNWFLFTRALCGSDEFSQDRSFDYIVKEYNRMLNVLGRLYYETLLRTCLVGSACWGIAWRTTRGMIMGVGVGTANQETTQLKIRFFKDFFLDILYFLA